MYEIDTQVIELAIQLKERRKRGDATVWRVVDILVVQPVLTANEVARQLRVTFPAANDAIAELVALEILRPSTAQRRNRVFQASTLTDSDPLLLIGTNPASARSYAVKAPLQVSV